MPLSTWRKQNAEATGNNCRWLSARCFSARSGKATCSCGRHAGSSSTFLRKHGRLCVPEGGQSPSCQFLAQTTYLYTSVKQSPKALLERESERVKGVEVDTDHPAAAPANNPWHRPYFLQQAH